MYKIVLSIGCISAALGVILGAFGAHGLKELVSPYQLDIFKTGVSYQFYHSFALILLALFFKQEWSNTGIYAAYAFAFGIAFFSGSLYLLAIKDIWSLIPTKILGPITPLGGLLFIVGWVLFLISVIRK